MRRYESLRASDADRDAVTDRLHQAAVEGRLEPDELEERVHAALRARTYGELTPLVADLPPDGEVGWSRSHSRSAPLARVALVGAGLVAAIAVTIVVIAVVLLLLVAVATPHGIGFGVAWRRCRPAGPSAQGDGLSVAAMQRPRASSARGLPCPLCGCLPSCSSSFD